MPTSVILTKSTSNNNNSPPKKRSNRLKKSDSELVQIFWAAPPEAFFSQEIVAPVVNCKIKTLECDRWRGQGIPYRKCSGRVLYRKLDVVAWLEGHELISSTSKYKKGGKDLEHHVRYNQDDVLKFIEQHSLQTSKNKGKSIPKNL